ncbi:daunorubicin resistance protein DrrA family ABC transporter ATP-binding protein [Methanosphaerula palustris]|uniref:Daunorubicin resistance ABC transporter ATPase subunit n=1 Tax=Methanosphaerula palustris (strain ATCC BAA-1556 / DSM 19958 / E1-9c) TaxID=521011 RepID=B8GEP2_METPE|nr:daunorubicin resistance protein DrrA family ABC transporter ATP-binding protein [Methanosphaerula palustris]ACL17743.1 daunorubicin resistance ABC transporter ATPase subunit [Methanosphaerula palustris E1-9c]
MDAIEANNLHKSFGTFTAVDDVSIIIPQGEVFGFLGPNGAGKTTTIRMLTGVLTPDSGSVRIFGTDVHKDPLTAKLKMGVIPENGTVYSDLTAEQNILITAKFYGLDRASRKKKAKEILTRLGLIERRDDLVRTFSKGMRQRISIACAIVHSPQVLILDEPTTGLDVYSRRLVIDTVRHMNQEGSTILITTHNIEEANELCSTISIINKGNIVATGSPEKLKKTFDTSRHVEISFDQPVNEAFFSTPGITRAESWGDKWRVYTDDPDRAVKYLASAAERDRLTIVSIATSNPTLEEAFVQLTAGV